jgi:hypothetical protein
MEIGDINLSVSATHAQRSGMAYAVIPPEKIKYIPCRSASKAVEPSSLVRTVSTVAVHRHAGSGVIMKRAAADMIIAASGKANIISYDLHDACVVFYPSGIAIRCHQTAPTK